MYIRWNYWQTTSSSNMKMNVMIASMTIQNVFIIQSDGKTKCNVNSSYTSSHVIESHIE